MMAVVGTTACEDGSPPPRVAVQARPKAKAVHTDKPSSESEEVLCYNADGTKSRPATETENGQLRTARAEVNKGHLKVGALWYARFSKTCYADAEHRVEVFSTMVQAGGKFCYQARLDLIKTKSAATGWYHDEMERLLKESYKACPATQASKYDPTVQTSVPADFVCDTECQLDAACVQYGDLAACVKADALREQRIKKSKK